MEPKSETQRAGFRLSKEIVIAYAEAKDINISLDDMEKSEQMER